MTSKELIKLLQEEDPEGNCHVRTGGGAITFVERKEGYWDGPYSYVEGEGVDSTYVISTQSDKLDIHTIEASDWIWGHHGDYSKIRLDLTYSDDRRQKEYLESFKKSSDEYKHFNERSIWEMTTRVLEKIREGFIIVQDKDRSIGQYNSMEYRKDSKKERLMQGETMSLLESGFFKPVKVGDHLEWQFTLNNDGYRR